MRPNLDPPPHGSTHLTFQLVAARVGECAYRCVVVVSEATTCGLSSSFLAKLLLSSSAKFGQGGWQRITEPFVFDQPPDLCPCYKSRSALLFKAGAGQKILQG